MKPAPFAGLATALDIIWSSASGAAEIKVLSIPGVKAAVDQLIQVFTSTGLEPLTD